MPVPLGKTGVVRGFRNIGKNCACAGGEGFFMHEKRLLYPTNCWAEVPNASAVGVSARIWGCAGGKRPQYRIVAKIIPRGIVGKTTPQYYSRPNRLQIRKFRIVAPCKWPPFYIEL